ncbi:MAG: glycosyltransferase family 2 protein [Candidatus Gastranaerophilales bacterium]|nr:glycosyltransferase family 2 protein [Candidatus Gastranaerophilales bacterium]
MNTNIIFSIIIVTYNRNELLKDCLNSFKNQSFKSFEVLIVDRGSVPSAKTVVEEINDNRFFYERSSQEIHFCDVVNETVKKTKGQYLCVFGDDDVINSQALEIVNSAFMKNKNCDIAVLGSASVVNTNFDCLKIPSHLCSCSFFPYFKNKVLTEIFSGKEWVRWILSAQFIGKVSECSFPCYLHPSVFFMRKGKNFYNVIARQGGIAVKPSFDSGYLGLAHYTDILFINAPLVVINFSFDNVSKINRRFWQEEIKDLKYLPKIAQLENRGAGSILNVLHKNNIEKEYDITIQKKLYRKIIRDIEKDYIWDKQTIKDYFLLLPYYLKSSKIKIDVLCHYIYSIINGIYIHLLKKEKLEKTKKIYNCINAKEANSGLEIIFKEQIQKIKESFL